MFKIDFNCLNNELPFFGNIKYNTKHVHQIKNCSEFFKMNKHLGIVPVGCDVVQFVE